MRIFLIGDRVEIRYLKDDNGNYEKGTVVVLPHNILEYQDGNDCIGVVIDNGLAHGGHGLGVIPPYDTARNGWWCEPNELRLIEQSENRKILLDFAEAEIEEEEEEEEEEYDVSEDYDEPDFLANCDCDQCRAARAEREYPGGEDI